MKRSLFLLSVFSLCLSAVVSAYYQGRNRSLPAKHRRQESNYANSKTRLKQRHRSVQVGQEGSNIVNNTNTGYGKGGGKGVNTANIFRDRSGSGSRDDAPLDLLDLDSPASAPVEAIVALPTTSPTGSPVRAPTMIPSSRPTPFPSRALSPVPSTAPSFTGDSDRGVNSFQLSDSASLPQCETTFGVFGSLEGESLTVEFGYELETDPQKLNGEVLLALRDKVLPLLEIKMNDLILSRVFPRLCEALEIVEDNPYRLIEGISARPVDVPLLSRNGTAVPCLKLSVPDSDCHVVRGGVTIYGPFANFYNLDDSARVLKALETVMQDYEFSAVAPSIRRISYVNLDDDDIGLATSATTDEGNNNSGGERSPILPIALAGAGGLCFVILAWAYNRGKSNDDMNTSFAADSAAILSPEPTPQSRSAAVSAFTA
jgi:hypothetical protein